jgi:hypothetical protein
MKKRVFVADSYHSNQIAKILSEIFGNEVEVFSDPKYLPLDPEHAKNAKKSEEMVTFENNDKPAGINIFFLSARLIKENSTNPNMMKSRYGNSNSKVVAISVMEFYLNEVKMGYGVDFTHDKNHLINAKGANDISAEEKELLLSYLSS